MEKRLVRFEKLSSEEITNYPFMNFSIIAGPSLSTMHFSLVHLFYVSFLCFIAFFRGSTLAEFLNHGDPRGGLKKSVKELQEYDPKAVEQCRTFAIRYSKQLYHIYKNKEDPFFP